MTFGPFNPNKPYRRRTAAQDAALHNLRLRGLWYHAGLLTGERRETFKRLIDDELLSRGVETQSARAERKHSEFLSALEKDQEDHERSKQSPG